MEVTETPWSEPARMGAVPLTEGPDGVIRLRGSRVTLDSVVAAFFDGAAPEEIVLRYPTLDLADVYVVVGFYIRNRTLLDTYLDQRRAAAGEVRAQVEQRWAAAGVRERLLKRGPVSIPPAKR